MRRQFLFIIMSVCIFILSGCRDMDYKKACNEHDWDKAYAILHEMEKDIENAQKELDKANEDFSQEPRYDVDRDIWGNLRHTPRAEYEKAENKVAAKSDEFYKISREYEVAEHYVVLQEGLFLLERGDNESLIRIAFLVKERNAPYLWDELIDVAKSFDDKSLYNKLMRMSGKDRDSANNTEIQEFSN